MLGRSVDIVFLASAPDDACDLPPLAAGPGLHERWHTGDRHLLVSFRISGSTSRITGEEEQRRLRAYETTETDAEAAAMIGVPRAAFHGWRVSRRLPVRPKKPRFKASPEELETVRRMLQEGASFESIAAHINEHGIGNRQWVKTAGSVAWNAFRVGIISKEQLDASYEETKRKRTTARADGRDAFRSEVLKRDGACCATCGSRKQLEVDHIIEFWKGETNDPTNGITLCRNCHGLKTRPRGDASWHTFAERYAAAVARLGFSAEIGFCTEHRHHYVSVRPVNRP